MLPYCCGNMITKSFSFGCRRSQIHLWYFQFFKKKSGSRWCKRLLYIRLWRASINLSRQYKLEWTNAVLQNRASSCISFKNVSPGYICLLRDLYYLFVITQQIFHNLVLVRELAHMSYLTLYLKKKTKLKKSKNLNCGSEVCIISYHLVSVCNITE